jgi:DNA-binding MarR family transcriptional regulator
MTSQILRTLQKRGLVLREQIEGDERAKYSSLSPAGKKLVKKAAEIMKKNEKEYFAPVKKDMEQFLMYLKNLTRIKEINLP